MRNKTANNTSQATIANVPVIAAVEHALFSRGFPSGAREAVIKALIAAAADAGRRVDIGKLNARIAMLREASSETRRQVAICVGPDPWGHGARAASERASREAADDFSAGSPRNPIDCTDGHGDPVGRAKAAETAERRRRERAARERALGGVLNPIDFVGGKAA